MLSLIKNKKETKTPTREDASSHLETIKLIQSQQKRNPRHHLNIRTIKTPRKQKDAFLRLRITPKAEYKACDSVKSSKQNRLKKEMSLGQSGGRSDLGSARSKRSGSSCKKQIKVKGKLTYVILRNKAEPSALYMARSPFLNSDLQTRGSSSVFSTPQQAKFASPHRKRRISHHLIDSGETSMPDEVQRLSRENRELME